MCRKDIGEGVEVISIARGVVHREGCHISTRSQERLELSWCRRISAPRSSIVSIRSSRKTLRLCCSHLFAAVAIFRQSDSGCAGSRAEKRRARGCSHSRSASFQRYSGRPRRQPSRDDESSRAFHGHGFPALSAAFRRVQATSTGPVGAALACRECDRYAVRRCATPPIHTGRDRTAAPSGTRAAVSPCLLGPGMFSQGRFHAMRPISGRSAKGRWQGKHFRHPRPTCR